MSEIFKAYDIRGIFPEEVNEELAYEIGKAFVDYTKTKTILIGQDMRESSPLLFDALAKGITEQGANVIHIGLCSTPMFYFAVNFLKADAGIMVTASHNPARYNGFKLTKEKAIPITYDGGIKQIKELINKNKFKEVKEKGTIEERNILHEYANYILSIAKHIPKLKITADTSNGMTGYTLPIVLEHMDIELIHINKELDGNFPNHEANPLNLEVYKQLQQEIKKSKSDFGVMFDGDGDRAGFVDEKGEIVTSDLITALISKLYKNEKILYDLRSSKVVKEEIEKNNKAIIHRVGHSFIKETMRKQDVVFAGELSGHYYYKMPGDLFAENSILSMIKIAQIIEKEQKPLSEIIKPLRKYFHSGEINSDVDDKEAKMNEIKELYKDADEILEIDGISIYYKDYWFNVRASNTEPLLRLNLEANTESLMKQKVKELLEIIRK